MVGMIKEKVKIITEAKVKEDRADANVSNFTSSESEGAFFIESG